MLKKKKKKEDRETPEQSSGPRVKRDRSPPSFSGRQEVTAFFVSVVVSSELQVVLNSIASGIAVR